MSTGFEKNNNKTEASFKASIDSFDITSQFQEYFRLVLDPRVERTRYHLLTDIITIAILAVIAGAKGWSDIEEYGINKKGNRSGGDQKNVQYEITRNQYENQSRLDLYRIIVSSQKCYTGLQIVF